MEDETSCSTETRKPKNWIVAGRKEDGKSEVRKRKNAGAVCNVCRDFCLLSTEPGTLGDRPGALIWDRTEDNLYGDEEEDEDGSGSGGKISNVYRK